MKFLGFELCDPAYYYLLFSLFLIILFVLIKMIYTVFFKMNIIRFVVIKLIFLVVFVFILNMLCKNGLLIVSWILMSFLIISWVLFSIIPNLLPF